MLYSVFSLIAWNTKPWTKQIVERLQQILAYYVHKSLPTIMIIFWGFQNLLIYLKKYFWLLLNSSYSIFQLLFCKSNLNKTVYLVFFIMQRDYNGYNYHILWAKIYFSLIKDLWSKKVKKRDWMIHENLFT